MARQFRISIVNQFLFIFHLNPVRNNYSGREVNMIVKNVVVHPNFTEYQNDVGKCQPAAQQVRSAVETPWAA